MQPCFWNETDASFASKSTSCVTRLSCDSLGQWRHKFPNGLPPAFASIIYSTPTGLSGFKEYACICGTGKFKTSRSYRMIISLLTWDAMNPTHEVSSSDLGCSCIECRPSVWIRNLRQNLRTIVHRHEECLVKLAFDALQHFYTYNRASIS